MKNDFAKIYPDGITKAAEQYIPADIQPSVAETPAPDALDYSVPDNWAYFELGEDRAVDVFLICPTVDTRSETNSFDLNDKLRGKFIYALDLPSIWKEGSLKRRGVCSPPITGRCP